MSQWSRPREEKRLRAYRHSLNGSNLERGALQLAVSEVSLRFGGVQALSDVSVQVCQGEIHAVIGPNGAGLGRALCMQPALLVLD